MTEATDRSAALSCNRFVIWLVATLVALNALAVLSSLVGLNELRQRDQRQAELKSRDLSLAVATGTDKLLDKIGTSLRATVHDVERSIDPRTGKMAPVQEILARQLRLIPETTDISVIDDKGFIIAHDGRPISLPFFVGDRDYFRVFEDGGQDFRVSYPLVSRISGKRVLVLARRYNKPDGRFGGIVTVPAHLEHFESIVGGYTLGEGSLLALTTEKMGLLIGTTGGDGGQVPDDFATSGLPAEMNVALSTRPAQAFAYGKAPADDKKRVYSASRLSMAPLYAICAIAEDEFLADWYKLRRVSLFLLVAFALASHAVAFVLYRFWRKQQEDGIGLRESNDKLQAALAELRERDNALITASEVGGLGTYSLNLQEGDWIRSPEQEAIFGIGADFPRHGKAWRTLIHEEDLPRLDHYVESLRQSGQTTFDLEYRVRRPSDGAVRWIHGVGKLSYDAQGLPKSVVGVVKDVTEQKENHDRIAYLAYHDILTDLPNRALLADRLHLARVQAWRRGELLAVCYLDLDGFKPVNEAWGHDVGDMLLIQVARRLQSCTRAGDTVSRLGGDEFIVLLCGIKEEEELKSVAERMLAAIAEPYPIGDKKAVVTVSMGLTVYPHDDAEDADALIRHADQAMYEAKRSGKNRIHRFDSESDRLRQERQNRHVRLIQALKNDEFCLFYQPKVDLRTGAVSSVEALIRWRHPEQGLLLPGRFLPDIENTDFTKTLGDWVLREALRQKRRWMAQGLGITVCLNVFGHHLQQADFIERFVEILAEFPDVPPSGIDLEILETTAMRDLAAVSRRIEECARLGIDFALDDFGTGYSSLTYFRHLPVSLLKIDRSFVADILTNPVDQALVESIVGMAHALNRKVIAEGVETLDHAIPLLRYGCDYAQGFGIARPMPGEEVLPWIETWRMPDAWAAALAEKETTLSPVVAGDR